MSGSRDSGEMGLLSDGDWKLMLPRQNSIRWAPIDIRATSYDPAGQLWFACPQGVGHQIKSDQWELFTAADGLPFNDFTCMAATTNGVWFGTTNGAIRYFRKQWEFRHGKRWLIHNHINEIAWQRRKNYLQRKEGFANRILPRLQESTLL